MGLLSQGGLTPLKSDPVTPLFRIQQRLPFHSEQKQSPENNYKASMICLSSFKVTSVLSAPRSGAPWPPCCLPKACSGRSPPPCSAVALGLLSSRLHDFQWSSPIRFFSGSLPQAPPPYLAIVFTFTACASFLLFHFTPSVLISLHAFLLFFFFSLSVAAIISSLLLCFYCLLSPLERKLCERKNLCCLVHKRILST